MKKKIASILIITFLIIVSIVTTILIVSDRKKFRLDNSQFYDVVAFEDKVDLSNLVLVQKGNKNKKITVTEDMVSSCDSTDSLGEKKLVIKYKNQKFVVNFTVKYRVKFLSNNEIYSLQYVNNSDEIIIPQNPSRQGYEFIRWNNSIPEELNDNIIFNAIFSSTTLEVPSLSQINATYGDKLSSVVLPSNENGEWVFVDDLEKTVGDAGKNEFSVKFIPSTTELVERYNKVTINVSKKKLTFKISSTSFVYDGSAHFPEYTLSEKANVVTIGQPKVNANDGTNDEKYEFAYIIQDKNYQGSYYGEFTIKKANVIVSIENKTINYGEDFEMGYDVTGFENIELLNISLVMPNAFNVGTYEIDATSTNANINLTVIKGRLIINQIDLNPAPADPVLSTIENPAIYGDKLSTVTFESLANGRWEWKNPNDVIDKIIGYKNIAIFIPNSANYKIIEREIEVTNIDKKTLSINVKNFEYTYDGHSHTIEYVIENGQYENLIVNGNVEKTDAGKYVTTLSIQDDFYKGVSYAELIINKATPQTDFTKVYEIEWKYQLKIKEILLNDGYSWLNEDEILSDVGEYNCQAKFTPSDLKNYNEVVNNFKINVVKATSNISNVKENYTFVYTGNKHIIEGLEQNHNETNLTFTYLYNDLYVDGLVDAGEYFVTITLDETAHYKKTTATTKVLIKQASINVTLESLTAVYEDCLQDVKLPIDDSGVWAWKEPLNTSVGDAGQQTHIAVFTPNDDNYAKAEFNAKIIVSKKIITINILKNEYTYDKTNHKIEYSLTDTNEKDYSSLSVIGNEEYVNAGKYNITLIINEKNYQGKLDTTLTINKAELTPKIPTNLSATYLDKVKDVTFDEYENGYWIWLVDDLTLVGDVGNNNFSARFIFNEQENCDNYKDFETNLTIKVVKKSVEIPTAVNLEEIYTGNLIYANVPESNLYEVTVNGWTNVGEYNVELTLTQPNNYIWSNGEELKVYIPFKIIQAQAEITNLAIENWTFGETAKLPTAETNFGTIEYSYSNEEDGVYSTEQFINAGVYHLKAEVIGNENYKGTVKKITYVINKAILETPEIDSKIYTGDNLCSDLISTSYYSVIENLGGTEVGDYAVKLKIIDSNYVWNKQGDIVLTLYFKITQAENNWVETPNISGWTYQETIDKGSASSLFGEVIIEYKQKDANDSSYSQVQPIIVGDYTARFTVIETKNYTGLIKTIDYSISKASIKIPSAGEKVYTGSTLISDIVSTNVYIVEKNLGGKDVGSYDVVLLITDFNYKWENDSETTVTIKFNITQAQAVITDLHIDGWEYDQIANTPSAETNFGTIEFLYSNEINGNYSYVVPVNAGTYFLKALVKEENNFKGTFETISFVIAKANTVIRNLSIDNWIYKHTPNTPSAITNYGEISYLYSNSEFENFTNTIPENAGDYYVKAYVNEGANYKYAELTISFKILKETITALNNQSKVYTGEKLYCDYESNELYTVSQNDGWTDEGEHEIIITLNNPNNYKWSTTDSSSLTIIFSIVQALNGWKVEPSISSWKFNETPSEVKAEPYFGTVVIQYKLIDSDTYLSVLPEDAGEYVAIFTVDAEDEYSGLSKTINFEIFKAEVSQPEIDSKPYNASIQIADISDTLVYQVSKNDGGKDVGTYYVELTIIDANYKWENTTQAKIDVPFVITQGQADVTNLKIENWTYNKDAKTPTAEKNFGNIYFTYSNSLTGQFSSVAPTNAGKHYVKATIDTTANYLGDYEIIEFEIYKAISKISNLKIDNWTYNEESKTPSANCNIGEIVYTYLGENDSTYSNNAPDYAGQHTLKAEIIETDNYYGCEETINFVIYQANVKSPNVGFKTYSKETLKSDITGNDIYSVTQNNGGVDVGFYDVKLTITDSNYKWEDSLTADLILKFEIQQATNEWISLPEIENWTFGEDAKQPSAKSKFGSYYVVYKKVNQDGTYIDTNLQEAGNFVAIFNVDEHKNYTELCTEINFIIYQDSIEIPTYNAEYTGVNMVANVNGGTQYVATINNGGVNVGTYNVELKIIDSNYKWKDKEDISVVTTFNITKSKAVITDLKLDDWRYKEPNTPTAQTNFGIIKYYYSSEESTGYEETQPENVGNYYLKAVVEETLNYDGCSEIIEFKITQNSAVITDLKIDDWKYGSNPNEPSAKTNFGIISYSYYDENNSLVNELINAGNYYVKATVEGCDNYTGDEKTFDFVIEKFELDIPTFEPKKYTGSTLSCGLTSNEKYTVENGEGIDANTYVVSLTIINSNYKWKDTEDITVTSNFVIEKGQEEITSLTLSDWTYLNKPEPNNPTANSKFGEIYYYYSDSENGTYESTQPQTPGTYWLKAVVEETENYYGDVEKISFKISKAQPVIETLSIDNWVYNADPSNPYIEKSSFVDDNNLTFFYKEGTTNDGEWSISVPTLAGEYTLKAVIAETDTHLSCEETTTFKILKDTPVITAPVYDTVYLNIVDLSNDYASAPVAKNLLSNEITGEWSYGSINFVDGENASTFTLTFNPSDSNNYNSKSVTVNLTVKSVARISSTYYATIEDALENAVSGNVVMVLPDTTGNVMIKEEVVVINTGVTLSLPFGPNDADRTTDGVAIYDVGDSSSYGGLSKLSCKSIVTVAENVVIKNYGILEVNGQMSAGGGGHKYSSHTAANYAELRLLNGSKIESYGDMKITGFIYDYSTTNASEIIAHQGTLYMPFVMRDFRGGSYMFAVYIKIRNYSTSPFNEYQFRNISSRLTLKYDAKLVGYGNLYASSTINTTTVNFVGNSSSYMVQFTTSDSYLVAKYDLNTEVCDLDLYGGATVNKMTMKIVGYSIDTSKVYFPLNWAFDISFNKSSGQDSATYNLPNKYKMLTGSYITINKGAVVTIESLNIYESYTDGNSTVIYPNKPAAKLVVRGTLNCTNLGGKVYAEKDTSDPNNIVDPVVNVTGNTTVTTYETAGKVNGSSFLASIEKWNAFTHTYQLIS